MPEIFHFLNGFIAKIEPDDCVSFFFSLVFGLSRLLRRKENIEFSRNKRKREKEERVSVKEKEERNYELPR